MRIEIIGLVGLMVSLGNSLSVIPTPHPPPPPAPPGPPHPAWLKAIEWATDSLAGITVGLTDATGFSGQVCFNSIYTISRNIYYITESYEFIWPLVDSIIDIAEVIVECPVVFWNIDWTIKTWYDVNQGYVQFGNNIVENMGGLWADLIYIVEDMINFHTFWIGWDIGNIFKNVFDLYEPPHIPFDSFFWGMLLGADQSMFSGSAIVCINDTYNIYKNIADMVNTDGSDDIEVINIIKNVILGVGDCRQLYWYAYDTIYQWYEIISQQNPQFLYKNLEYQIVNIIMDSKEAMKTMLNQSATQAELGYYLARVIGNILVYHREPHFGSYDDDTG